MTAKHIENLPPTTLDGSELVHVVDGGNSRQTTVAAIVALALGGGATAELIRDVIGAALVEATGIDVVINDALDTITVKQGPLTVEAVAGATYTYLPADVGKHKRFTNAGAVTFTIDNTNGAVAGDRVRYTQAGAGQVTMVAGGGVTLNSRGAALKSTAQYAVWELECVAANEFDVLGDLTA